MPNRDTRTTGRHKDRRGRQDQTEPSPKPTEARYITAHPHPSEVPLASNVNFLPGQTVANAAIVATRPHHAYYNSNGYTHIIIDVFATFSND